VFPVPPRRRWSPCARESGDPGHIALPAVWRARLDRSFSAGLQAEAMLNAITMMMDREDVQRSPFRYVCGVCWTTLPADHAEAQSASAPTCRIAV
jgi:hypothetical protein